MAAKDNKLLVPILSAGNFAIGMGAFVVIGILNPLAEGLGLTASEALGLTGGICGAVALLHLVISEKVLQTGA